jgi:23S rRNA pseudouridine2457 synthase
MHLKPFKYYIIYKPFQVLSQFSKEGDKKMLADFFNVEKDVYPVGRLDYDSEGLLILTNDKQLNHRLLHPDFAHKREYYVQVDGAITSDAINTLQQGVSINIDGKLHKTKPATASLLIDPIVCERTPPIRFRKDIPTSWISLILTEGKNRQVRKMTAAVGFPTLRLIRYKIETLCIDAMKPADMIQISKASLYKKLFNE